MVTLRQGSCACCLYQRHKIDKTVASSDASLAVATMRMSNVRDLSSFFTTESDQNAAARFGWIELICSEAIKRQSHTCRRYRNNDFPLAPHASLIITGLAFSFIQMIYLAMKYYHFSDFSDSAKYTLCRGVQGHLRRLGLQHNLPDILEKFVGTYHSLSEITDVVIPEQFYCQIMECLTVDASKGLYLEYALDLSQIASSGKLICVPGSKDQFHVFQI